MRPSNGHCSRSRNSGDGAAKAHLFNHIARLIRPNSVIAGHIPRHRPRRTRQGRRIIHSHRRIVFDAHRDRPARRISIAVRGFEPEPERNHIIGIAAIGMIQLVKQRKAIRPVRIHIQGEHGQSARFPDILIANQAHHNRNPVRAQSPAEQRPTRRKAARHWRNNPRSICAIVNSKNTRKRRCTRPQICFVNNKKYAATTWAIINILHPNRQSSRGRIPILILDRVGKDIRTRGFAPCHIGIRTIFANSKHPIRTNDRCRSNRWNINNYGTKLNFGNTMSGLIIPYFVVN